MMNATGITTDMLPGCCGLKIIHHLGSLAKDDAYSKKEAEAFDGLVNTGKAKNGQWKDYGKSPDTIAIISNSDRYNKPEEFKRQVEFLKAKGWQELFSWKSQESGGTNYMWGSPGIKITSPPRA